MPVLFTYEHKFKLCRCKTVPELQCQIHEALAREGIRDALVPGMLAGPADYLSGTLGEALQYWSPDGLVLRQYLGQEGVGCVWWQDLHETCRRSKNSFTGQSKQESSYVSIHNGYKKSGSPPSPLLEYASEAV